LKIIGLVGDDQIIFSASQFYQTINGLVTEKCRKFVFKSRIFSGLVRVGLLLCNLHYVGMHGGQIVESKREEKEPRREKDKGTESGSENKSQIAEAETKIKLHRFE